jgi:hypothetical protein
LNEDFEDWSHPTRPILPADRPLRWYHIAGWVILGWAFVAIAVYGAYQVARAIHELFL